MAAIFIKNTNPDRCLIRLPACFLQPLPVGVITLVFALIQGCSNSDTPAPVPDQLRSTVIDPSLQPPVSLPVAVPEALAELQVSAVLTTPLPPITSVEILAESGLQVVYTHVEQNERAPALSVEAHWLHMQSCLSQVGVAPVVLIRSTRVVPLTQTDHVIHSIEGIPVATATVGSVPVIQIGLADFTIVGDDRGYNLRSIMGRLLWSSAGLSVRDYPYSCARQWVETD